MHDNPLTWRVADLMAAYRRRELSPIEVTELALTRTSDADGHLNAFLSHTDDLAREQARTADRIFADGHEAGPLTGVPVAVKDAFHIAGHVTTLGSRVHRDDVAEHDSGVVRRLRAAGAVFVGKTNTAEFGQSATTDNLLRPDCRNPWDIERTSGGSSGGSAAAVAAGLAPLAVGSDGGGSIRIPAAFCGVFGMKPTSRLCPDEGGFVAMAEFVAPGPLARHVDDARRMLGVLADTAFPMPRRQHPLRIGYCARPLAHPVDPAVARVTSSTASLAAELGHDVVATELPLAGWDDIFGPMVLADEAHHRMHLLVDHRDDLTAYERRTLEAASQLDANQLENARGRLRPFRARIAELFVEYDVLLTPATAVPAFHVGQRPRTIADEPVSSLWGAFPFTSPFNVAGTPAASLPAGMAEGLPVGVQLVTGPGQERQLLAVAEQLEEAIAFDWSLADQRWALAPSSDS